jgi:phage shock protein PspC (stress-responsive transcriptional regulator)
MARVNITSENTFWDGVLQGIGKFLDQVSKWITNRSWIIVVLAWAAVLVVAFIGLWIQHQADANYTIFGLVYLAAQVLTLEADLGAGDLNCWLDFSRALAPILILLTATKALTGYFQSQIQIWIVKFFFKRHVVICGLGRKGWLFTKNSLNNGEMVVVVEKDPDNELINRCKEIGATVIIGDAEDDLVLQKASVIKSKRVICVCGPDGVNADITMRCKRLVEFRSGEALTCYAHIYDPELTRLLRAKIISMGKLDSFRLEFFNIFRIASWLMLQDWAPAVEKDAAKSKAPHFLIVGMGWLGESLIVHTARKWWDIYKKTGEPISITVIDRDANRLVGLLKAQYDDLSKVCQLSPVEIEIESEQFERADFLSGNGEKGPVDSIFICIDDQPLALTAAIKLANNTKDTPTKITVRLDDTTGFSELLNIGQNDNSELDSIHVFGLFDKTCAIDAIRKTTTERIAEAIHQVYLDGHRLDDGSLPDKPNMKPWNNLGQNIKESNRRQADHIGVKLQAVDCVLTSLTDWDAELFRFEPDEIELLAEMEHDRWCDERTSEGCRYGPVRDEKNKIHNCLLPWEKLPEENKEVNRNTVRAIPKVLALVGLEIYRIDKK